MLDIDRFVGIAEGVEVFWHIWVKVGSEKDGDLMQCYPVEPGVDREGVPYGHVGKGDLSAFAIIKVKADKEGIRKIFKKTAKNSKAYKSKKRNYSFVDIDEAFSFAEVSLYRDRTRQVPAKDFNVTGISDYRKKPERLDREAIRVH